MKVFISYQFREIWLILDPKIKTVFNIKFTRLLQKNHFCHLYLLMLTDIEVIIKIHEKLGDR